jgi:hypothetical protein
MARPDVPPQAKAAALRLIAQAKELVGRHGPYDQIADEKIKARLKSIQDQLNAIATPAVPQTPTGLLDAERLRRGMPPVDRAAAPGANTPSALLEQIRRKGGY